MPYPVILYRKALLLLFILIFAHATRAQVFIKNDYSLGKNNVSEGLYVNTSLSFDLLYKKNALGIGGQIDLFSRSENRAPAFIIEYSRYFTIKKVPFGANPFYIYNRFSDRVFESNYGILLSSELKFWHFSLGTNFRTYGITDKALSENNELNDNKIHENFNMMYRIGRYVKPKESKWNIALYLTNFDHFIINQETNPYFGIVGSYRLKDYLMVFLDTRYISSGAFNLSVNPFGLNFKTGLTCYLSK